MHIFLPPTDALHNDRKKIQKYYCAHLKPKKRERNREIKKMELENIIITSKQPEYKENETLNFLLIFVCYIHDFVPSIVNRYAF